MTDGALFIDYRGQAVTLGSQSVIGIQTQPVPEPASMAALGLGAVAMLRRRKRA